MEPKHGKEDYAKIMKMTPQDIHSYAFEEAAVVKIKATKSERHSNLIKIQKKQRKQLEKRQNNQTQGDTKLEIQRIIDNPELMQTPEQALDLIEMQDFTVKELSRKEIKKMDKLRENAMSDIEIDGEVVKPAAMSTAVKIS